MGWREDADDEDNVFESDVKFELKMTTKSSAEEAKQGLLVPHQMKK